MDYCVIAFCLTAAAVWVGVCLNEGFSHKKSKCKSGLDLVE